MLLISAAPDKGKSLVPTIALGLQIDAQRRATATTPAPHQKGVDQVVLAQNRLNVYISNDLGITAGASLAE